MTPSVPKPLTAAWLSEQERFPAPPDAVHEEPLPAEGEDEGVNSSVSLVQVSLAAGGRREAYVAKRAATGPSLGACLAQRWLEREYRFYTEIARCGPSAAPPGPRLPAAGAAGAAGAGPGGAPAPGGLRVPRCAAAQWAAGAAGAAAFVLLLERLAAPEWERADPAAGCSREHPPAAVEALGRLHAAFAGEGALRAFGWLPVTAVHVESAAGIQQYYAGGYAAIREHVAPLLPEAALAACDGMCGSYARLLARLARPPWTLVHGDFRLENLRFSAAASSGGEVAVAAFDWQFVCRGRGAYDLACFLALSAPPEERRRREAELLRRYLGACGEAAPDQAQLEEEVRLALLLLLASLIMGVLTASSSTHEMHKRAINWLGCAVEDWGCLSCLDAMAGSL